jgi:DNA polymerase I-like protein with 3'-5' exonuclease and polymerase domains
MNVAVLDLETSKKPILNPWQKGSYLSTIGIRVYLEDAGTYYKEWVWYHGDKPGITEQDRLNIVFELQEEIDKLGPDGLLVGHNIKFDANWLKTINVDISGVHLWDTMITEFMLLGQDKTLAQDLSSCCARRDIPIKTDVMKTYWDAGRNTHEIPLKKVVLPYQKNDIEITALLFKEQWIKLRRHDTLRKLAQVRSDCLHVVTDIEINGMNFDRELAEKYVAKFQAELDLNTSELRTYFKRGDININSGRDLSAALFGGTLKRERFIPRVYERNVTYKEPYKFTYKSGKQKGMTITKTRNRTLRELTCKKVREEYEVTLGGVGFVPDPSTEGKDRDKNPNGIFQTNKDVLKLLKSNSKVTTRTTKLRILELLLYRSKIGQFTKTFVGTKEDSGLFYKADISRDGWLHPSYNQTIASTGRFTSSGPNGQNFPRSKADEDGFSNPLKRCFTASRLNGLILVVDLSQLEWRVAAWLSQDPVAMQEIRDGVDCHLDNAIRFFGDAKFRQDAKIFTFRLLYGGSAYGFFMDPKMPNFTQKKWNDIVRQYQQKYHVLTRWQEMNITQVGQDKGWLYSPTGRIYKIPMEEHRKYKGTWIYQETCIKNYPVQGTATGDIVPLVMNEIQRRMALNYGRCMSTNWMGQVHDSVLFDTIGAEVKWMAMTCIQVFEDLPKLMKDAWGLDFNLPMTGEAEWGPNYGDMTHSVKHEEGQWLLKAA